MSKFTPGPWEVVNEPKEAIPVCVKGCGYYICSIHGGSPEIDEGANARLIAAAPELYEALRDAQLHIPIAHKELHSTIAALLSRIEESK